MAKSTLGKAVLVAALLASVTPAAAQEAQPTTPSPASPSQNGTTTTPTPAPNATAPTPAPGETQLPTVQVIQKEQKTPANEQKKTVAQEGAGNAAADYTRRLDQPSHTSSAGHGRDR